MSTVYMLPTMRTHTMYVHSMHAINDENIHNVCLQCTCYQRWEHTQCMLPVYMLSTMRTHTMYMCPQRTCCQRWEHTQCMFTVYMLSQEGNGHFWTVYMYSEQRISFLRSCDIRLSSTEIPACPRPLYFLKFVNGLTVPDVRYQADFQSLGN